MNNEQRYLGTATGGGGYNPFASGIKHYGGGRNAPTIGPVDRSGYIDRDAALKARRNALLRRIQSAPNGQYLSIGK